MSAEKMVGGKKGFSGQKMSVGEKGSRVKRLVGKKGPLRKTVRRWEGCCVNGFVVNNR
jgi:hypothetical protein